MATLTNAEQWELLIPEMGYMACLRNLRNFDQAGISDKVARELTTKLADPHRIALSRQLPFRFLSAYMEAPSLRWGHALETALSLSLKNIPVLKGRTLILIDTSGSMENTLSARSRVTRVKGAALFALAQAFRMPQNVDVFGFADGQFRVSGIDPGGSLLKNIEAFCRCVGNVGHGTQIESAVRATFIHSKHDRVMIFTDMQTFPARHGYGYGYTGDVASAVPDTVPVYGFNLAGYSHSAMPAGHGNRHELGGLTDATFRLIPSIEAGQKGDWPWKN